MVLNDFGNEVYEPVYRYPSREYMELLEKEDGEGKSKRDGVVMNELEEVEQRDHGDLESGTRVGKEAAESVKSF